MRQLLAHQAGLFAIDEPVDRAVVADLDRLAAVLARQRPAWESGTRQAYHGLTLGFMKPCANWPFGSASSFGAPGSGGSLGFADPSAGVGYAYVTSQMGTTLTGDAREIALRRALYSAISASADAGPLAA